MVIEGKILYNNACSINIISKKHDKIILLEGILSHFKGITMKTILITGASRGIGRSIALKLAPHFNKMILCCHKNEALLLELKKELESKYTIECITKVGNVGDFTFVKSLFEDIDEIDTVINNAGISHIGLLPDMSPEEWDELMHINLYAAFYSSKLAIPLMLQKKSGHIINISSIWGNAGASMEVAYSASKGGLNSFTKALAKELAPSNIQVNAISCGVIDTDMNRCFNEEERTAIIDEIPSCRMGTTEEVADLALQILKAPSYLTGQIITMDGGYL